MSSGCTLIDVLKVLARQLSAVVSYQRARDVVRSEPIFLQYEVPAELHRYQRDIIYIGLFLSSGLSLFVGGLVANPKLIRDKETAAPKLDRAQKSLDHFPKVDDGEND